jgi:hypothetical protein
MRVASNIDNEDNVTKERFLLFLIQIVLIKKRKQLYRTHLYQFDFSTCQNNLSHIFNKTNLIEENNKTQTNIGDSDKQISFFEDKRFLCLK